MIYQMILDNNLKIITKNHFQDKFEMVNKKLENFS